MNQTIRGKVVKIGNSRGIRIPRALLEQAGLSDDVEMKVEGDQLIIQPVRKPREGWEAQFARMAANHDDQLLDEMVISEWDEEEWTW
jgi:antitoxin MazE